MTFEVCFGSFVMLWHTGSTNMPIPQHGSRVQPTRWRQPMASTDFTEQWSSMQKMFLPSSEISATFRENARRFWENQGKVLENIKALANGWFDRRRTGTYAAREAAERMYGTAEYFDLMQGDQGCGTGELQRVI